jgi:hypothetical protein
MLITPLKESKYMLVIPRKINDQIVIGDITVTVVAIDEWAGKVKLEIGSFLNTSGAPPDVQRCPPQVPEIRGPAKALEWQEGMKAEDRKQ